MLDNLDSRLTISYDEYKRLVDTVTEFRHEVKAISEMFWLRTGRDLGDQTAWDMALLGRLIGIKYEKVKDREKTMKDREKIE